jgi:5'-nucleotidase
MSSGPTWAVRTRSQFHERTSKLRILLTNDDGINAPGLAVLERIARTLSEEVWIVAPESDQSGLAHSLSLSEPLRLREVGDRHFALRGTPTDCVIMAVREIMPEKPDLVLSGVNSGANIADDVTYSGTVAGAMEGTLLGIRSIALSQAFGWDNGRSVPWATVEAHAPKLLARFIDADLPDGVFINLNFPNCQPEEIRGSSVTVQGRMAHALGVEKRNDGRGFPYYWLKFERPPAEVQTGTDIDALRNKYISITPMALNLTAHEARKDLEKHLE